MLGSNLPKSNSIVIRTDSRNDAVVAMGSGDVAKDITMKLPLILRRVRGHVICINEISSYFIDCEGFREALGSLLILGNANLADFITRFWGQTAFLLEGHGAVTVTIQRHDCGTISNDWSMLLFTDWEVAFLLASLVEGFIELNFKDRLDGFSAGLVRSPVCCLES